MQMEKSEFEIDCVTETVNLSFQGFDLIIDSFDLRLGDFMIEVIQDSGSV